MDIVKREGRGRRRGPEEWFSGEVWMEEVISGDPFAHLQSAVVSFAQGARTAWHTHPIGQVLYVTDGTGWVQKEGEAARRIGVGDVVVIRAGENHWHGAGVGESFAHLAMQESDAEGKTVVWGRHVAEEEYTRAVGPV